MKELNTKYGSWTIIGEAAPAVYKTCQKRRVLCVCDCGNQKVNQLSNLVNGLSTRCITCKNVSVGQPLRVGDKVRNWEVISPLPFLVSSNGQRTTQYLCRCICGHERPVRANVLKNGTAQACRTCVSNNKLTNTEKCYDRYRYGAEYRDLGFDLTFSEFLTLSQADCTYCGSAPSNSMDQKHPSGPNKGTSRCGEPFIYNGIDRIDSLQGYSASNCVTCCKVCNRAKADMTLYDFLLWIERLASNKESIASVKASRTR